MGRQLWVSGVTRVMYDTWVSVDTETPLETRRWFCIDQVSQPKRGE